MESFSKRLEAALQARQMRQSVLAQKIGVSRASITMYLQGKTIPRKNRLFKISEALDVQSAWLLGYDVSMMAPKRIEDVRDEIRLMFDTLPRAEQQTLLETLFQLIRWDTEEDADAQMIQ